MKEAIFLGHFEGFLDIWAIQLFIFFIFLGEKGYLAFTWEITLFEQFGLWGA